MRDDLIVGRFYWVFPVLDPDAQDEWETEIQPARFNGTNADGELLWHCIGIDGSSNWPMRWIGDEVEAPSLAGKELG